MRTKFGLIIVALLSTTSVPACAGEQVLYGPAPQWAQVYDSAKINTAATIPLALLDVQERIEGETLTVYVDQAFKLASPESLTQGGTSTASWMPDKGDLTIHRVDILRGGKAIDVLKGGARYQVLRRETGLERRQIDGQLTATLAIPGLEVGDVLRIAFSQTTRDQALQGRVQIDTPLLALPVEAGFARTTISWPENAAVKWQAGPDVTGVTETVKAGWRTVSAPVPLPKREDLPAAAPTRFTRGPTIEATTFTSWEDVSQVFAPLYATKGAIAPGSPLAAEMAKIAATSTDPLTRAALATRLVQDQIGYLLNGMSGGNYVPQAPAETWTSRFGDCKAKSLMLLALLEGLGITAEVVAVNSQRGDAVPTMLPKPAAFDHVIVRAQIAGVDYWLDGTATGTRLSNIADTPPFRHALPIKAEGTGLVAVTPRVPAVPTVAFDVVIDQRAGIDVPALVSGKARFSGMVASQLGAAMGQAGAEQKHKIIETFANGLFNSLSNNGGLVSAGDLQFDSEGGVAEVTFSGIVSTQFGSKDGARRLDIKGLPSADVAFDHDRSRASWRQVPVELGQASQTVAHLEVLLPTDEAGYKLGGRPEYEATYAGSTVKRSGRLEGTHVIMDEAIGSLGGELPAAEIPAEKAKALRVRNTLPFVIAPPDAARLWAYRKPQFKARLVPVEAAYAAAIAWEPEAQQASPLYGRAGYRAGVYDLEGALADYSRAMAIEPDAQTYLQRGRVYHRAGRISEAIADYRKALALSPEAENAMVLANALGLAGQTEEALALIEQYDDFGEEHAALVEVRADVLGFAGKGEAGLTEIENLIDEKPQDTSLRNSACWYRARFRVRLDTVMDLCNSAMEGASDASEVLDSRALAWIALGNMTNAIADAEAAIRLSPGQTSTHYLRAFAAKALGKPGAAADLAYLRQTMPGLAQEYARYGLK